MIQCEPRDTAVPPSPLRTHSVSEEVSIGEAFRVVVGIRVQLEREDVEPHLDVNRRRAERELRAYEIMARSERDQKVSVEESRVSPALFYPQGAIRGDHTSEQRYSS